MKIVVLTQNFAPEMGAKATRLFELTTRLAARGHTVTVVTAMPNYPTGRVFEGYRGRLRVEEEMDGVRVVRTWVRPSDSARPLPRLVSYLSFMSSGMFLGWRGLGRQDVLLFDSPPLFLVPAALALGRIAGARIAMNVSDIWPDVAVRLGLRMGVLTLRSLRGLERWGYGASDVVLTPTAAARDQIAMRFPHVRSAVVSSGVDLDLFRPSLRSDEVRRSLGAGPDDFLVGYCGLHGLFQGLEAVVEAADLLRGHRAIRFVMVGDGPSKASLVSLADAKGVPNLRFEDTVPRSTVASILASCDAAVVPLAAELPGTMPSKVYEALASGVPLIVSQGCEAEALVNEHEVGRTFAPLDSEELASAVIELADHTGGTGEMGRRARELAGQFDLDQVTSRAEAVLMAVSSGNPLPVSER